MQVLVPGGAGFLGCHLCERLLAQGHDVLALDDLSTGDRRHVVQLAAHPRFRLLLHDITQPLPHEAYAAPRIFNLACPASPAYYQREPVQTALTCVLGMWRLLELAQSSGARLLQASTSEVYGDPEEHPQSESYRGHVNPIGPRACYDESAAPRRWPSPTTASAASRSGWRASSTATARGSGPATAAW